MRSETLLVTPLADHLVERAGDRQGTIARQKLASDARAIRFIRINSSGPVCDSWRTEWDSLPRSQRLAEQGQGHTLRIGL